VKTLPIVEDLDVVERCGLGFLAGAKAELVDVSNWREAKRLSIGALSRPAAYAGVDVRFGVSIARSGPSVNGRHLLRA
jgi:hypothetical protein